MIRHCPNCDTERPLTELFCEGTIDGHNCGWDLSTVDITAPGAPKSPGPTPAPETPTCRNGHPIFPGDIICGVCSEPIETAGLSDGEDQPTPTLGPQQPDTETTIEGWRLLNSMPSSSAVREQYLAVRDTDGRRVSMALWTGS